jgi:hypothetical protein
MSAREKELRATQTTASHLVFLADATRRPAPVVDSAKLNTKEGVGAMLIQDRDARMRGEELHRIGFGRTRPVKIHQTIMGTLAQVTLSFLWQKYLSTS